MTVHASRWPALAVAALLIAVACASDGAATPGAPSDTASPPSDGAAVSGSTDALGPVASEAVACGDGAAQPFEHPDWPLAGGGDAEFLPILMTSLVTVGPTRLVLNVTGSAHQGSASPDVQASIDFYALERDPATPGTSVDAHYLDAGVGQRLYRATVDFDCAGEWGAEVSVLFADGRTATQRLRFEVHPAGTTPTPAIGQAAPRSHSPTAATLEELRLISTDPDPYPRAYELTIGEVVTSGQPSLILFATPAFCRTGHCGPMLDVVKSVALDYEDDIGIVNVEPYELHMTENGLQPVLDPDGFLKPVQSVLDYGIPVEPYLFLVDAEGDVFAKFEGVVGADELRTAIEDVLSTAA